MIDLLFDADRVKSLRRRLGLTQRAFAERLGVAQPTVANWETGDKRPEGPETLMRLIELERDAEAAEKAAV